MLLSKILILIHFYWILVFGSSKIKFCEIGKNVLQNHQNSLYHFSAIAACAAASLAIGTRKGEQET